MKYSVEIEGNEIVETLEFRNKEYTRNWIKDSCSLRCNDPEFVDQLESDGIDDEDILVNIQDYLSDTFIPADLFDIAKLERES